jgi:hypothetical protein
MNGRHFLATAAAGALAHAAAPERPNVLFLMADQFRADALGVSGNDWISTPNLNRLAQRKDLFSTQPAKVKELARLIEQWGRREKDSVAVELARKQL